jgi:hypothetical protein
MSIMLTPILTGAQTAQARCGPRSTATRCRLVVTRWRDAGPVPFMQSRRRHRCEAGKATWPMSPDKAARFGERERYTLRPAFATVAASAHGPLHSWQQPPIRSRSGACSTEKPSSGAVVGRTRPHRWPKTSPGPQGRGEETLVHGQTPRVHRRSLRRCYWGPGQPAAARPRSLGRRRGCRAPSAAQHLSPLHSPGRCWLPLPS